MDSWALRIKGNMIADKLAINAANNQATVGSPADMTFLVNS